MDTQLKETKVRTIRSIIQETQIAEYRRNREYQMSLIPAETESFLRFFGIEPDGSYFDTQLNRVVFYSGDVYVTCYDSDEYRDAWGIVYQCKECGYRWLEGAGGWNDMRYLKLEPYPWMHNHDRVQNAEGKLIEALRELLGLNNQE